MVEGESRISCEVEFQEFWGKNFGQRDVGQLIAAQIDALKAEWNKLTMSLHLIGSTGLELNPLFECLGTLPADFISAFAHVNDWNI